MSAKPKAKKLAGEPGNLQDVSDLQQMLAQSQAECRALEKRNAHLAKTMTTLIDQRDAALSDKETLRAERDEKAGALSELADRVDELEDSNANLLDAIADQSDDVQVLIGIRNRIARGDGREVLHDLDRLLNFISPAWTCGGCNVGMEAPDHL